MIKTIAKKILASLIFFGIYYLFFSVTGRATGSLAISKAIAIIAVIFSAYYLRADKKKYQNVETDERKQYNSSFKNKFKYIISLKGIYIDIAIAFIYLVILTVATRVQTEAVLQSIIIDVLFVSVDTVVFAAVDFLIWLFALNKVFYILKD